MKVLITTDWYQPVINGVVTSIVNLTEGLKALGYEVKILTLSNNKKSYVDGDVIYIGSIGAEKVYPNARISINTHNKLVKDLIMWKPDIVHSQCEFSTFLFARYIAKKCHIPLVHTYHTVYEDFTHYFAPNVKLGKYMASKFSRWILNKTQVVIAPTNKTKQLITKYGVKSPVFVIPSGLNLSQFLSQMKQLDRKKLRKKYGIKDSDEVLIFLGRLAKEKNIDELFKLLKEDINKNLKLLLVGDGPYRNQLEDMVDNLKIRNQVIFTGMVSPKDVPNYYKMSDIFVSASQSETQGLTYIEAMASGLAILCRDDPCLSNVVENGKNGFTYTSAEEFHKILSRLLIDVNCRKNVGKQAMTTVSENFSIKGFAREVSKVYNALAIAQN